MLDPVAEMIRVDVVKSDKEIAVGKSEVTSGEYVVGNVTVVLALEIGALPLRIVKCGLMLRESPNTKRIC